MMNMVIAVVKGRKATLTIQALEPDDSRQGSMFATYTVRPHGVYDRRLTERPLYHNERLAFALQAAEILSQVEGEPGEWGETDLDSMVGLLYVMSD